MYILRPKPGVGQGVRASYERVGGRTVRLRIAHLYLEEALGHAVHLLHLAPSSARRTACKGSELTVCSLSVILLSLKVLTRANGDTVADMAGNRAQTSELKLVPRASARTTTLCYDSRSAQSY